MGLWVVDVDVDVVGVDVVDVDVVGVGVVGGLGEVQVTLRAAIPAHLVSLTLKQAPGVPTSVEPALLQLAVS
jgi:hypothetical protein